MNATNTTLDLLGLTDEQYKMFHRACHSTLDSIFSDAFGHGTVRRSDIIEVVLDADHLKMFGFPFGQRKKEWQALYEATINPWIRKNYHTPKFKTLMNDVFPFATYSL